MGNLSPDIERVEIEGGNIVLTFTLMLIDIILWLFFSLIFCWHKKVSFMRVNFKYFVF